MQNIFSEYKDTIIVVDLMNHQTKGKRVKKQLVIRQRIDMHCTGCKQEIFTTKALDEIHKASAGIPRMINRVCEKALMYAFQNQKRLIDDYMIKFVVEHEMLRMVTS